MCLHFTYVLVLIRNLSRKKIDFFRFGIGVDVIRKWSEIWDIFILRFCFLFVCLFSHWKHTILGWKHQRYWSVSLSLKWQNWLIYIYLCEIQASFVFPMVIFQFAAFIIIATCKLLEKLNSHVTNMKIWHTGFLDKHCFFPLDSFF